MLLKLCKLLSAQCVVHAYWRLLAPGSQALPRHCRCRSDVTKGRILLPRAAVEANLSFAIGRAHSLAANDHNGRGWEFTLQSWANGAWEGPMFSYLLTDLRRL